MLLTLLKKLFRIIENMTIRARNPAKTTFSRDAWVEIDLNALEYNCQAIKNALPHKKIMAVLKSDAYGHGAVSVGLLMQACNIDYFGVASVDEGIELREAGIEKDILILSPTPFWAISRALEYNLEITVSSLGQLNDLIKVPSDKPKNIQVKVNTGMNRSGAKWNSEAILLIQTALEKKQFFNLKGIYSHFACGSQDNFTNIQLMRFKEVISQFAGQNLGLLHIAASSMLGQNINPEFDMFRIGIGLYGIMPECSDDFKPVLSLMARISHLQPVCKGEGVGYNLTWTAERDSLIGLLPLGYADGVKRGLSNQIQGIYQNQYIQQVGNISMDQICFDFTDCKAIPKPGEIVTLIGKQNNLEIKMTDWAKALNTIEYEIACDLRVRLPKVYIRN